ncbi:hypothetical protein AX760_14740 [Pararhizobium antarcticum]|uniref:Uncharacterized protein n=1 Tax=Pararhizobium antarcticum TaxID=1798805 RepID=A0A657LYK0_9HYPH|nr:hypothetical protein AX761_05680 [Rhizobium sp. 58]OJF98361.1 hypothetical protein AX760_14740 [Pararhizobium antarcticum]
MFPKDFYRTKLSGPEHSGVSSVDDQITQHIEDNPMNIPAPTGVPGDMTRSLECEHHFSAPIRILIDQAVSAGWTAMEVFTAIEEVVKDQRQAQMLDPDPAEASEEIASVET